MNNLIGTQYPVAQFFVNTMSQIFRINGFTKLASEVT